jgi:hypothetical protein
MTGRVPEIISINDEPVWASLASITVDLGFVIITRQEHLEPTGWPVWFVWASDDSSNPGYPHSMQYGHGHDYIEAISIASKAVCDDYPEDDE